VTAVENSSDGVSLNKVASRIVEVSNGTLSLQDGSVFSSSWSP
jgi:hypothetical protein